MFFAVCCLFACLLFVCLFVLFVSFVGFGFNVVLGCVFFIE